MPRTWVDRVVEKPRTFTMQNNVDGTVTLVPAPGAIVQVGTPVNAANLNGIETDLLARAMAKRVTAAALQSTVLEAGFYTNSGDGLLQPDGVTVFQAGWWHVQVSYHDVNGYGLQIATCLNNDTFSRYYRSANGFNWGAWRKILDERDLSVVGWEKIASVSGNGTAVIDIINIPVGYKMFKLLVSGVGSYDASLSLTFNGDVYVPNYGTNATATLMIAPYAFSALSKNAPAISEAIINNCIGYSKTYNMRTIGNAAVGQTYGPTEAFGIWKGTAEINKISIKADTGVINALSKFVLLGIK